MRLRRVALQPVDRAGLGRLQRQPVGGDLLQLDEERFAGGERFDADGVGLGETKLEGELADEGVVIAARAP